MLASTVAALAAPLLIKYFRAYGAWFLSLFPLAMTITLINAAASGEPIQFQYAWMPEIGFDLNFYADGLSYLLATLVCGIGFLIFIYARGYLGNHQFLGRFYMILSLFLISMLGLAISDNLILLFIFWELTSLTSYLLIGFSHQSEASRKAANQALLVTAGGGLALLVGFILMGVSGGSYNISELKEMGYHAAQGEFYFWIFLFIALGAFTKSAQFPFHFWLPGAMQAPTPVSAYLHSATMVKAGVFLLARLQPLMAETPLWFYTLATVGGFTMLLGAYLAVTKTDLKQILAYTTLSVLGLLTLTLSDPSGPMALAFVYFLMAHALYKGALFMVAGAVDHEMKTREITSLSGLRHKMPMTATVVLLAVIAMAGVVPTLSFISKESVLESVLTIEHYGPFIAGGVGLASICFTFIALMFFKLFFAKDFKGPKESHEASWDLYGPPMALAFLGIFLGVFPGLVEFIGHWAAASLVSDYAYKPLSLWHGFNLPLLISALVLALGVIVFFAAKGRPLEGLGKVLPWSFSQNFDKGFYGFINQAGKLTGFVQAGYLRIYLKTMVISTVALMLLVFVLFPMPKLELKIVDLHWYEALVFVIIAISSVAATAVQSRLATISCLGVIGFMVAIIYVMFSAPDLALTQILVETLTVIMFALVIYRLPVYWALSTQKGRVWDWLISISFGAVFSTLILYSSMIQWHEPISHYFHEASWTEAYGRNVVNVILVDFRAIDTLGEVVVVAVAAAGVYTLLRLRRRRKTLQ